MCGITATSFAQNPAPATASATATIIAPLSIALTGTNLNFGNIVVVTGGTVVIDTAGVRTASAGVTLPAGNPGTVTPAQFTVTGTAGYTYGVTLPTALSIALTGTPATTMALSLFTSSTSAIVAGAGTGIIGAGGTQALTVGATLTVGAAQAPGVYTNASFPVSVFYN
jgi:hypothetical protein